MGVGFTDDLCRCWSVSSTTGRRQAGAAAVGLVPAGLYRALPVRRQAGAIAVGLVPAGLYRALPVRRQAGAVAVGLVPAGGYVGLRG